MNGMPNPMAAHNIENLEFMQNRGMGAGNNSGDGRHALQDYQLQLMLLEQQNKKRLLQARREQDTITTGMQGPPGAGPGPGGMMNNGVFAPNMSPQGSRGGGPSPNPADQMKRGTPKIAQSGLPGSPMPDIQQRNSPGFDPGNGQIAPGMSANYYQNMRQQPQTSHPSFQMQQMQMPGMTPQQVDQINANRMANMQNVNNGRLPNGQLPPGAQGMQFAAQGGPMGAQQQRGGNMAPPPAPAEGPGSLPPRAQESSPAQPPAPPTPSQSNKAAPKKKETAAQKKKNAPKKGANATAATPTESSDAPVSQPATPMTPSIQNTFPKSGAPPASSTQTQAPPPAQASQPSIDHNVGMFGVGDENEVGLPITRRLHMDRTFTNKTFSSETSISILQVLVATMFLIISILTLS
jgi:hypothetical protein